MCALKRERKAPLSRDAAETLAIRAIGFLAEEPRRISRFLALTGMDMETLVQGAETAAVQVAVLDHLLGDESLLMVFAGHASIDPETVSASRALLDGGA